MSFEVEFNQVAIAVADMLARQMDDVFLGLVEGAGTEPHDPSHRTAEAANRIVVLCRRLTEEVRRYERCELLRREVEEDNLPF
jgi:hypothetical protein